MATVFPTHVRLGALASAGSKHATPASAILDLLDDAVEQRRGAGAKNVLVRAGVGVPHMKARPRSRAPACARGADARCAARPRAQGASYVVIADDGIGMDGPKEIEWNLTAQGSPDMPKGDTAVSFFNTGFVSALAALARDGDVVIATASNGTGTLVRWGAPMTNAIHEQFNRDQPNEHKTLQHAVITFDMRTGKLRPQKRGERRPGAPPYAALSATAAQAFADEDARCRR